MEDIGVHGGWLLALLILVEAEVSESFEELGGNKEVLSVLLDGIRGIRVEELLILFVEGAVFRGLLLGKFAEGSAFFDCGLVVHPSFMGLLKLIQILESYKIIKL